MGAIIIGISGKLGSGKDEAFNAIRCSYAKFENKKYASKLKQIAGLMLGCEPELFENREFKDMELGAEWDYMTVRTFLQKLGSNAIRFGLHENAWVNALFSDINDKSMWVITDVRFPNEVDAIHKRGGKVIRINRGAVKPGVEEHISETALDHFNGFDAVINNNGTIQDFWYDVICTSKKLIESQNGGRLP